jgi:carnosine N-methyltransferase
LHGRYVLKNLVRDWGEEGAGERAASYGRILLELRTRFRVGVTSLAWLAV